MKKNSLLTVLLLGLSLVLAACSSKPAPASTSIDVTLTDYQFTPNTFTIPAGAQISFKAVNNGSHDHSFLIMKKGDEVKGHFTDADKQNVYWGKEPISVGQTVTDTFTAPGDPGIYQIVCGEQGHFEAGMVAKLIVVKP